MAGQLMAPRSDVTLGTRPLLVLALTLIAVALYAYIGDVRLQTFLSLLSILLSGVTSCRAELVPGLPLVGQCCVARPRLRSRSSRAPDNTTPDALQIFNCAVRCYVSFSERC
jgi:hypothetical protein